MQHEVCNGCHKKNNPKFTQARKQTDCMHCHTKLPELKLLFGMGRTLSFSMSTKDLDLTDISSADRFMTSGFTDSEFEIVPAKDAEFHVICAFSFHEVHDRLLEPSTGIKLFWGKCTVKVILKNIEISSDVLTSKVWSGKKVGDVKMNILNYLTEKAFESASEAIASKSPDF